MPGIDRIIFHLRKSTPEEYQCLLRFINPITVVYAVVAQCTANCGETSLTAYMQVQTSLRVPQIRASLGIRWKLRIAEGDDSEHTRHLRMQDNNCFIYGDMEADSAPPSACPDDTTQLLLSHHLSSPWSGKTANDGCSVTARCLVPLTATPPKRSHCVRQDTEVYTGSPSKKGRHDTSATVGEAPLTADKPTSPAYVCTPRPARRRLSMTVDPTTVVFPAVPVPHPATPLDKSDIRSVNFSSQLSAMWADPTLSLSTPLSDSSLAFTCESSAKMPATQTHDGDVAQNTEQSPPAAVDNVDEFTYGCGSNEVTIGAWTPYSSPLQLDTAFHTSPMTPGSYFFHSEEDNAASVRMSALRLYTPSEVPEVESFRDDGPHRIPDTDSEARCDSTLFPTQENSEIMLAATSASHNGRRGDKSPCVAQCYATGLSTKRPCAACGNPLHYICFETAPEMEMFLRRNIDMLTVSMK